MHPFLPAALRLLSLSAATAQAAHGEPIGPLAQRVYPAEDDDRTGLFLHETGDNDLSNFNPWTATAIPIISKAPTWMSLLDLSGLPVEPRPEANFRSYIKSA